MILMGLGANLAFEDRSPVLNMGKVLGQLDLHEDIKVVARSSWYRTAPVGGVEQPDFVNGVALLETSLTPLALMRCLLDVEIRFGRVRSERWGPRTMDLDLLDFDGRTLDLDEAGITLHLPHPRLHERAFVLRPMLDVAPGWRHPVSGAVAADLLRDLLSETGGKQAVEPVKSTHEG